MKEKYILSCYKTLNSLHLFFAGESVTDTEMGREGGMGIKTYMWQVEKCKSVCSFKDSRVVCSTMVEIRRLTLYRPPSLPAWQRRVVLPNHYHKYHIHFYRDVKNYAGET